MKRLISAAAIALAFTFAYVVTPRAHEKLEAQVGIPCQCSFFQGTLFRYVQCLGTGDMSSWSCNQFGTQCLLGGFATWTPDASNCVYAGGTSAWIQATATGTGGPSYFDPSMAQSSIPWGILSRTCSQRLPFGAAMVVAHDLYSWNGSKCICTPNSLTSTTILSGMWTCIDV